LCVCVLHLLWLHFHQRLKQEHESRGKRREIKERTTAEPICNVLYGLEDPTYVCAATQEAPSR
jgi:hypothetical protein